MGCGWGAIDPLSTGALWVGLSECHVNGAFSLRTGCATQHVDMSCHESPSPMATDLPTRETPACLPDCEVPQGRHRTLTLGGAVLGRVASGLLVVHGPQGQWSAHSTLVGAGDWLGTEWQGLDVFSVCVSALVETRIVWHRWEPAHTTNRLTSTLLQQKQRAAEWLAMRSGTSEQRCRHLLRLLAHAAVDHPNAGHGYLPPLKDMARLVDLAPETTCRVLARLRAQPLTAPAASLCYPMRPNAMSHQFLSGRVARAGR